ncbi:hypothetical protein PAESOLCIP111_02764 [Paenibacillus solanacearum]|uniref:DUF948 domain-containing protein n=1 Tax=Paenibacillus solanacearum TaxID=2048548 RepID=A0A916K2Q9_9BACL|nr:DUF948 domain-containing protein [Paenibacillus solanacearum]CAG7625801.1 hypothetical protein PAESOLCIP111_02764 [Paenibacillus solanacearum]
MWWQYGVALCMAAFLIVTVYGIRLLRRADAALQQAEAALQAVQRQVTHTAGESERLFRASTALVEEVQVKLAAADAWFKAANETGEAMNRVSRSVKVMSQTVEHSVLEARRAVHNNQDTVNDLMELTTAGIHLWHRLQAYKRSKSKE